jgi:hypothetical protein
MKGDQLYLRHILEAIERIESYIVVGRDVFITSTHWQDAVIRQLEIIVPGLFSQAKHLLRAGSSGIQLVQSFSPWGDPPQCTPVPGGLIRPCAPA